MRAVGYRRAQAITEPDALFDIDLAIPEPGPHDLRVAVKAVSVNPADIKLRASATPPRGEVRVLGFDAAGVVDAVGSAVTLFKPGDEVYYAGSIDRPGTNSEFHLVDEHIVGHKPRKLSYSESAAIALTSITAWELLFDRLGVPYGVKTQHGTLLIINGAGGVGSMLTQIACRLTGLTVVCTASRHESVEWCLGMGAHHVISHHEPLIDGLRSVGIEQVEYVASLTATDQHLPGIVEAMAPQGNLAMIDDPLSLNIVPLKTKSIAAHWELMFTRPLFHTVDMIQQHRLLDEVAELMDSGVLRTTLNSEMGPLNATNLKRAHAFMETGRAVGKTVLTGF